MSITKEVLLEELDRIEKDIGKLIGEACGTFVIDNGVEPMALQQARIRYGEGGLWLRHHIERSD